MYLEICLAILSAGVIALLRTSSQAKQLTHLLKTDITDLHGFSQQSSQLISNLNDLSSDPTLKKN